jgi:hypothetical protein
MPITAYLNDRAVVSTELAAEDFDQLRHGPPLQFRCGVRAIPRRSRAGFPHFYHQSLADCQFPHTNPETDEHRAMKSAVIRGAIAAGWAAEEEYPNDDRTWIADVMVSLGERRIAFEAQWSKQDDAQFQFRTDRYRQARMETVWFYRHADAADEVRHGLIPVRKRDDGVIVTVGADDKDGLTVEAAVTAILMRTAWWKFARDDVEETLVTEWSAVPCLGCGATNVRAVRAARISGCARCNHPGSRRVTADAAEVIAAAAEAAVEGPVLMTGTACGGCAREIGDWSIEVGASVANFTRSRAASGALAAHWCVPDHDVENYADVTRALTAPPSSNSRTTAPATTAATTVRKSVAEVRRRLEKAAHTNQLAREKKAFMASPEGKEWLKKRREDENRRNMAELLAMRDDQESKRIERDYEAAIEQYARQRAFEFVEAQHARAGRRTLQDTHELTMLMRDEIRMDGTAAERLVAEHGQLDRRCLCSDCKGFRARLTAHTIEILFAV